MTTPAADHAATTNPTDAAKRPVVVGVDGSQSAARAAVYAAHEAGRRGLPLVVVHVTPWRAGDEPMPMTSPETRAEFQESATLLVEAAAEVARQETGLADITARVIDDHPVDGLLALSAGAALLVVGQRGAGGLTGLLLGSTAQAVVQHAQCPVLALPDEWVETVSLQPVVAGVDGLPGQDEVLEFAFTEAGCRGTGVVVLHAWRDVALEAALGRFGGLVDWDAVAAEKRARLSELVAPWRERHPDVEVRETVLRERSAVALRDASVEAALLVIGHRPRRGLGRLGSTTNGILHSATCPVAVVPLPR